MKKLRNKTEIIIIKKKQKNKKVKIKNKKRINHKIKLRKIYMSTLGNHALHINIGYTSIENVEIIKVSTSSLLFI